MTFSVASFDSKPGAGFKRSLAQRRQKDWVFRAMDAEAANSQRPVRRILLKALPKEFWAKLEPAEYGDAFVLFARPLDLLIDFAEAGGIALNEPGVWNNERVSRRPIDYLMRRVNAAYRNDPRYSAEAQRDFRDLTLFHLAAASISIPVDAQAITQLRPRLRPVARTVLNEREKFIGRVLTGKPLTAPSL